MKTIILSSLISGAAASLMALFSPGCAEGGSCDGDNMVRDRNFCVCAQGYSLVGRECVDPPEPPAVVDTGEGGAGGAGDMTSGSGGTAGPLVPVEPDEFFGVECTVGKDADTCGGAAITCAAKPGETEGVCSTLGCNDDTMVVCPIGWHCFALGDVCLLPRQG